MKKNFTKFINLVSTNEFQILPGNIAYSLCFSIVPIVSIIIYIFSSLNISAEVIDNVLLKVIPRNVIDFINPVFSNVSSANQILTILLSLIVIINGCNTIITSSNTVFNIKSKMGIRRLIKSTILAIILILLLAFMLIVPLFGKSIINIVSYFTDFISNNESIINTLYIILQMPVSLIVMFIIIKLIYIIAPDDKIKGKYVNKGALFTTISWLLVTILFSYYINNIANFNIVYGSLTNVVILLFWLYILSYIFVIGLCLNRNYSEHEKEKTNKIALDEIRKKVIENQKQE